MSSEEPQAPSVFAPLNQDEMISRIESTNEDDLDSAFFDDSAREVEDAAVRMFDIGIRTLTDDPDHAPQAAFGVPASSSAAARAASAIDQPVAAGAVGRFTDAGTRTAFILGGPAALHD